ncbi:conjugative transposon protein TraM [Larkinella insperata]|uniref:Conjugative transposon protein TraM n=1 Tax=Larkinella insperata TaxID=332158 RepID=A0ABW3Q541_9BACT
MSTATATLASSDDAFFHRRKAYLVFPVIVVPFLVALFWIGSGGKSIPQAEGATSSGFKGFNMNVPSAENSDLKQQTIDPPLGGSTAGQTLSKFTNTEKVTTNGGLRTLPNDQAAEPTVTQTANMAPNPPATQPAYTAPPQYTAQPHKSRRVRKNSGQQGFQYHAPQAYYVSSNQTDQQLESQLNTYQTARSASNTTNNQPAEVRPSASGGGSTHTPNFIQLDDNVSASRLDQSTPSPVVDSPFNTAPVGQLRREGVAATLESSGYNKRAVTTMVPAVVHDDQSVKAGQSVKLRLTKAIVVDGLKVPANTIVHATCQPDGDRLRLVVQSLQLGNQLISLDMEAVDMDGRPGLNAPGLSDQLGGQLKSSAVQGVNLPTRSMLVNTVLNAARFGASSSVRQSQIHLKGGYHLHLKSI